MLAACSGDVPVGTRDGGAADSGLAADAGSRDSGAATDARVDAATATDGGTPCTSSTGCGAGSYCNTPLGACAGSGWCESYDPSVGCDVFPDLVCGCDGHTYNNDCAARRAGVAVDHRGGCPPVPAGCLSDLDCETGDFCEFDEGACGGAGACISRGITLLCADICDPECACDGTTFQNPCLRRKAAMSLSQSGTCPGGTPPCIVGGACCGIGTDCGLGQQCVGATGPMPTGKCLPTGPSPTCWEDTDCGTGHTCTDPYVCPCGSTCPRPDTPGTCT